MRADEAGKLHVAEQHGDGDETGQQRAEGHQPSPPAIDRDSPHLAAPQLQQQRAEQQHVKAGDDDGVQHRLLVGREHGRIDQKPELVDQPHHDRRPQDEREAPRGLVADGDQPGGRVVGGERAVDHRDQQACPGNGQAATGDDARRGRLGEIGRRGDEIEAREAGPDRQTDFQRLPDRGGAALLRRRLRGRATPSAPGAHDADAFDEAVGGDGGANRNQQQQENQQRSLAESELQPGAERREHRLRLKRHAVEGPRQNVLEQSRHRTEQELGEALVTLLVGGIGELVGGNEEHIGPLQQAVDGDDRRAELLPLQGGLRTFLGLGLVRRRPELLQQIRQLVQLGLEAIPALDDLSAQFGKPARDFP